MTRNDRIHKLANAIREYCGARSPANGQWTRTPKPTARRRVERWLTELGIEVAAGMAAIDGFKTVDEMGAWMREKQDR